MPIRSLRLHDSLRASLLTYMCEFRFATANKALSDLGIILLYQAYHTHLKEQSISYDHLISIPPTYLLMSASPPIENLKGISIPSIGLIKLPISVPIPQLDYRLGILTIQNEKLKQDILDFTNDIKKLNTKQNKVKTTIGNLLAQHPSTKQALGATSGRMKALLKGAIRKYIAVKTLSATDGATQLDEDPLIMLRSSYTPRALYYTDQYVVDRTARTSQPMVWGVNASDVDTTTM